MVGGYPNFKNWIDENNIKQQEIADFLGYSRGKVNSIINGTNRYGSDFTAKDIYKLSQKYKLNMNNIFFGYEVALKQRKGER